MHKAQLLHVPSTREARSFFLMFRLKLSSDGCCRSLGDSLDQRYGPIYLHVIKMGHDDLNFRILIDMFPAVYQCVYIKAQNKHKPTSVVVYCRFSGSKCRMVSFQRAVYQINDNREKNTQTSSKDRIQCTRLNLAGLENSGYVRC